ncbi:hypothetical protein ABIE51_003364 [Lysobacter sp. OAE881]
MLSSAVTPSSPWAGQFAQDAQRVVAGQEQRRRRLEADAPLGDFRFLRCGLRRGGDFAAHHLRQAVVRALETFGVDRIAVFGGGEQAAQRIARDQQRADGVGVELAAAAARFVQQRFQLVRQFADGGEAECRRAALD